MSFFIDMNELCEARNRRIDDFVAEDDRKGFVADQPLGAEDRMAESGAPPTDGRSRSLRAWRCAASGSELRLAVVLEIFFQLDGSVEVVLDRAFAPPGDDDNVFDSGGDRFFYRVLNQRFIDERQHFFGRCFRRGRKRVPRPAAGITALRTSKRDIVRYYVMGYAMSRNAGASPHGS